MDYIPRVYYGQAIIQARKDGRFAQYEFTRWSQWFTQQYAHISIIPRPTFDPKDQLFIAYWTPTINDLDIDPNNAFDIKLGCLAKYRIEQLRVLRNEVEEKVQLYRDKSPNSGVLAEPYNAFTYLWSQLRLSPMNLKEAVIQVAEFQRLYFDITSFVTYYAIYAPRLKEKYVYHPKGAENLMGCITADPQVAFQMVKMRIPVWLSRRKQELAPNMNINFVAEEQAPKGIECEHWVDEDGVCRPYDILYFGDAALGAAQACRRLGRRYPGLHLNSDEPIVPRLLPYNSPLSRAPPTLYGKPLEIADFRFYQGRADTIPWLSQGNLSMFIISIAHSLLIVHSQMIRPKKRRLLQVPTLEHLVSLL